MILEQIFRFLSNKNNIVEHPSNQETNIGPNGENHLNRYSDILLNFWENNRGTNSELIKNTANEIIKRAKKENNSYALGWCYYILGWLNIDFDKYEKSSRLFRLAYLVFVKSNNQKGIICTNNGKASLERYRGNLDKAFEKFLTSLELSEKTDNKRLTGIIVGNMGVILNDLKQYDEAIYYYERALAMADSSVDKAIQHCNIGAAYRNINNYSVAQINFYECIKISKVNNDEHTLAYCYLELGIFKYLIGAIPVAQDYFRMSLAIAQKNNMLRVEARALLELGVIEEFYDNPQAALPYVMKSLEIFRGLDIKNLVVEALFIIAKIYRILNDNKNAFLFFNEGQQLESLIYNEEIVNIMGIMKIKQSREENLIYKNMYNQINIISKIGRAITSTFDIKEIKEMLYNYTRDLLNVDNLIIGLFAKNKTEISYKICVIDGDFKQEFSCPISDDLVLILNNIIKNEIHVANKITDRELPYIYKSFCSQFVVEGKISSFICSPLRAKGEILGLIMIQSHKENAYMPYHIDTFKVLTSYIATALENEKLFSNLTKLATTDSLTGLLNRRSLLENVNKEFARHKRYGSPFTTIMLDIDKFKTINDTYGHSVGDLVLLKVASILKKYSRNCDFVGRFGGDEFLIALPNTTSEKGIKLAKRILSGLTKNSHEFLSNKINIQISLGIAELSNQDKNIASLLNRADEALYSAKRAGGNKIINVV